LVRLIKRAKYGVWQMPSSKDEWVKITECATRIQYIEAEIKEVKAEIRNLKKERNESHRFKLTILIAFVSLATTIVLKVLEFFVQIARAF
jgi:hypothetical protein